MQHFPLDKKGKPKESGTIVIKIDALTGDKRLMRLGKYHVKPENYFNGVDQQIMLQLHHAKFKASTIEFTISVCDPQVLQRAQAAKAELARKAKEELNANSLNPLGAKAPGKSLAGAFGFLK